jgi:hypothetical protein
MDASVLKYLLPAVIGFISGILGSMIAPWVHWGVEKRRIRQAKRRELIGSCRVLLGTGLDKKTFRETEVYSKIRPHLSRQVIDEIEEKDTGSSEVTATDTSRFRQNLLEEVARIEREWVLI